VSQSYAICLISVLHLTAPSDPSFDLSPHLTAPDLITQLRQSAGYEEVLEREPIRSACRLKTWCGGGGVPKSQFTEWNSPEPVKHGIIIFKWKL